METRIDPEEYAYGARGGVFGRRGKAYGPDGKLRSFVASIPDTFFSVPARMTVNGKRLKGFVSQGSQFTSHEGELIFTPYETQ